jgi:hypothetical protein
MIKRCEKVNYVNKLNPEGVTLYICIPLQAR